MKYTREGSKISFRIFRAAMIRLIRSLCLVNRKIIFKTLRMNIVIARGEIGRKLAVLVHSRTDVAFRSCEMTECVVPARVFLKTKMVEEKRNKWSKSLKLFVFDKTKCFALKATFCSVVWEKLSTWIGFYLWRHAMFIGRTAEASPLLLDEALALLLCNCQILLMPATREPMYTWWCIAINFYPLQLLFKFKWWVIYLNKSIIVFYRLVLFQVNSSRRYEFF